MANNRAFFPQQAVDLWLADGLASLDDDVLRLLPDGPSFRLVGAVRFLAEVASGGDAARLVGKVKSTADIVALSGEHVSGSVVLGDDAYEVVDGFLAEVDPADAARALPALSALPAAG